MFTIASDKPTNNPVFALIIGVSDYTAYDPSGARDLPGAITDADSWADYCRHSLCLDNQHLLKLSDADGAVATERSSIIHGLQWLGEQLGKQEGVNDASALLTFSGHGLTFEHTGNDNIAEGLSLALAPSDIEAGFEAALLFSHIEEIIFKAAAAARFGDADTLTDAQSAEVYAILENITAVFDACYSRPSGSVATVRALSEGPVPQLPKLKVFSRLVLGAHLWQTAYEIQTAGVWHGAFSYALVTMLDQWRVQSDAQTPVWYVHAAYGDIVFRARSLLTTLGMPDQTPTLLGTQNNLALVPFLRPGKEVNPGWTSVEPDGPKTREEFSAGNDDCIVIVFQGKPYDNPGKWVTFGTAVFTTSCDEFSTNASSYTYTYDNNKTQEFEVQNQYWFFDLSIDFTTGWGQLQIKVTSVADISSDMPSTAVNTALGWGDPSCNSNSPLTWSDLPTFPTHASGKGWCWLDSSSNPTFGFQLEWEFNGKTVTKVTGITVFADSAPTGGLLTVSSGTTVMNRSLSGMAVPQTGFTSAPVTSIDFS